MNGPRKKGLYLVENKPLKRKNAWQSYQIPSVRQYLQAMGLRVMATKVPPPPSIPAMKGIMATNCLFCYKSKGMLVIPNADDTWFCPWCFNKGTGAAELHARLNYMRVADAHAELLKLRGWPQ